VIRALDLTPPSPERRSTRSSQPCRPFCSKAGVRARTNETAAPSWRSSRVATRMRAAGATASTRYQRRGVICRRPLLLGDSRRPVGCAPASAFVAKQQHGRPALWRSRPPLVPRHTPAAASRTSPVRSSGGEAPFDKSLSSGACVGLYDAHKSRSRSAAGRRAPATATAWARRIRSTSTGGSCVSRPLRNSRLPSAWCRRT